MRLGSTPSSLAGRLARWSDTSSKTDSDLYRRLRARQFVFDDQSSPLLDVLATKYRTKRTFLDGFTKLHIFVVTLRCDHSCHYCQVSRQTADRVRYDMTKETADRAIGLMFRSPSPHLTLEFQGGEPLLNFDLIRFIVLRCKEQAAFSNKQLSIVVATNLALATDEMLHFFRDEGISVSTSLDGPAFLHNANRPRPGGNSHELTLQNIERSWNHLSLSPSPAVRTAPFRPTVEPIPCSTTRRKATWLVNARLAHSAAEIWRSSGIFSRCSRRTIR